MMSWQPKSRRGTQISLILDGQYSSAKMALSTMREDSASRLSADYKDSIFVGTQPGVWHKGEDIVQEELTKASAATITELKPCRIVG